MKDGESKRLAQEGRRWTIGPFGELSVHLVDEMERQETRRDFSNVQFKRMYKFTGLMVEARGAQMLLARRRSETKKRRRASEQDVDGGGNWGL